MTPAVQAQLARDLRTVDAFRALSVPEAEEIAGLCQRKLLGPGDTLFEQGGPGTHLYVVLRGHVRVTVRSPDGDSEVVVGEVAAGSLLGEMAVLEARPRSASAHAVVATELLVLPGRAFAELVASGHAGAFYLLHTLRQTLVQRLGELDARLDAVFAPQL